MPVYLCRERADWTEVLEYLDRKRPGFKHFRPPDPSDDLRLPDAAAYCGWSVSTLNRARRAWREAFPDDHIEIRTARIPVQLLQHCTVSICPVQLDRLKEWWSSRPRARVAPPGPQRVMFLRIPREDYDAYGLPAWARQAAVAYG